MLQVFLLNRRYAVQYYGTSLRERSPNHRRAYQSGSRCRFTGILPERGLHNHYNVGEIPVSLKIAACLLLEGLLASGGPACFRRACLLPEGLPASGGPACPSLLCDFITASALPLFTKVF